MLETPGRPMSMRRYVGQLFGQPNLKLTTAVFLLGLLSNMLASELGGWSWNGISGNIVIIGIILGLVLLLYRYGQRVGAKLQIEEQAPDGKAGVILLISPLSPSGRGTPSREEVDRRRLEVRTTASRIAETDVSRLTAADFKPFFGTNLEPAFRALEFHQQEGGLRECWLISTRTVTGVDGKELKGSAWVCPLLEKWFTCVYPKPAVNFHYVGYEVAPRAYTEIWTLVDRIFRGSPLKETQIVCDVTGGLKLMSIGAALACISDGRLMQYMATDRDWRGEPLEDGTMAPIAVDITPYLSVPRAGEG